MNKSHDIAWAANKQEWAEAARFFVRVIAPDPDYISHGEIQGGLSLDGKTWAPDLERRFLDELGELDDARAVAIVREADGAIVAAAYVTWSFEVLDAPFATLQDLAVEPALRSAGLGAKVLAFVEDEVRRRGAKWLFLESGKNNRRAHAFFERYGFGEVSHVFAKRYD
jgi:ribosomal protein S18 acetylase RimI-like enzyme